MKKLFLLLALCGVMAACNSKEEETEKEKGAIDYYIEYMEAAAAEDHEAYNEAMEKYEEATKDMNNKEMQELYNDMNRWNSNNVKTSSKAMSNQIHMDSEYEKSKKKS